MLMTLRWYSGWIFLLLCFATAPLCAQQTPYDVFYRSNWQFANPAAIDRSHYLSRYHNSMVLNAGFRQQWIGLEGAPQLYFVSAEYCPEQENTQMPGQKFGLTAYGDKTDAIGTYGIYLNYSRYFLIPYTDGHVLHIGLSAGANLYQIEWEKIRLLNPGDPLYNTQGSQAYVDFSLGALYRVRKEFYLGLSIPQTFTLNVQSRDSLGRFARERVRHVYLNIGWFIQRGRYDYSLPRPDESDILIEPSAWVRYVPGVSYSTLLHNFPLSIDANLRVHYKQRFWVGAGYGTNGMINTEFGISRMLDNETRWRIGLGYGIPVGKKYLSLGHSVELNMGYYFR